MRGFWNRGSALHAVLSCIPPRITKQSHGFPDMPIYFLRTPNLRLLGVRKLGIERLVLSAVTAT
jgi:hypothetical protein